MNLFHYRPAEAGWLAVTSGGVLLLVETNPDASGVESWWSAISASDPVRSVLDVLTAGGLSSTPDFAFVQQDAENTRVIVRGALQVKVTDAGGSTVIDGTGVSTWVERVLGAGAELEVGRDVPATGAVLPLQSGAVWASWIGSAPEAAKPAEKAKTEKPKAEKPAPDEEPAEAPAGKPAAKPAEEPAEKPVAESKKPAPSKKAGAKPVEPQADAQSAASATPAAAEPPALPEATQLPESTIQPPPAAPDADESDADESDASGAEDDYAFLFGQTVMRSVEDAALREPEPADEAPTAPADRSGDHDGHTVLNTDLAKLRSRKPRGSVIEAPKYFLEISTGGQTELDGLVIVGRAPTSSKVSDGRIPQLVSLPGALDISRNHAQFSVEGDTVVITDLHSRNGTIVTVPGKSPQQLRAGEPAVILADTVVDLGGVTVTVKER